MRRSTYKNTFESSQDDADAREVVRARAAKMRVLNCILKLVECFCREFPSVNAQVKKEKLNAPK